MKYLYLIIPLSVACNEIPSCPEPWVLKKSLTNGSAQTLAYTCGEDTCKRIWRMDKAQGGPHQKKTIYCEKF